MYACRLLAMLLLTAPAFAADADVPLYFDVRMRVGGATGIDQVANGPGSGNYGVDIGLTWGAQGLLRHRFSSAVGYLVSLGFFANLHAGEHETVPAITSVYAAAGVELGLGLFWEFTPRVHAELMPFFQIGSGQLFVETGGVEVEGDSDRYQSAGVLAGGFYTFRFGLQLGGQVGWQDFSGRSKILGNRIDSEGAGFMGVALVGYSF